MRHTRRKITSSSENKTCAICQGGGALYTAICSHSFHVGCIDRRVGQSSYLCPICGATPNATNVNYLADQVPQPRLPVFPQQAPLRFYDDEPLPAVTAGPIFKAGLQNVIIKVVPEREALAASESVANFAVLVGLTAPPLSDDARQRAPIDLVMVLDVSGSMSGPKLDLLKRAVSFVIDNLGPCDRLSIVSFSHVVQRVLPLRRMTDQGRVDARRAVYSLSASGGTDIGKGLAKGVQVLEERLHRNPVASIMFLSDGIDFNYGHQFHINVNAGQRPSPNTRILPTPNSGTRDNRHSIPIHSFGFGSYHDPITMHAIANSSGGTFSFIESYEMVQDAFARCIGGLLSVVVRELGLTVSSATNGVGINLIPSGNYASEISDQGSRGKIIVGDMYADEEKDFLINISVPVHINGGNGRKTSLLDITCSYKDVLSNERVQMEISEIRRPGFPSVTDAKVKLEVDRQRNRLIAAEGIAEAHRTAENGDLKAARDIMSNARASILASESGQAGDSLILKIEADMKVTEEKMGCKRTYEQAGRAYALSNLNAHANQRATTRACVGIGSGGSSNTDAYVTPSMAEMVNKSQQLIKIEDGFKIEGGTRKEQFKIAGGIKKEKH